MNSMALRTLKSVRRSRKLSRPMNSFVPSSRLLLVGLREAVRQIG